MRAHITAAGKPPSKFRPNGIEALARSSIARGHLQEYLGGSNIARSVLAAAWQFRVRPPRVGGQ